MVLGPYDDDPYYSSMSFHCSQRSVCARKGFCSTVQQQHVRRVSCVVIPRAFAWFSTLRGRVVFPKLLYQTDGFGFGEGPLAPLFWTNVRAGRVAVSYSQALPFVCILQVQQTIPGTEYKYWTKDPECGVPPLVILQASTAVCCQQQRPRQLAFCCPPGDCELMARLAYAS